MNNRLYPHVGFKDLCEIGDQSRPHLFDLNIRKPKVLFDKVEEIEERVTIENYELDPYPRPEFDAKDPNLVKTESGEVVRIIQPLNVDSTRARFQSLRREGFDSVAICFIHSHVFPGMEYVYLFCRIIFLIGVECSRTRKSGRPNRQGRRFRVSNHLI